jgi:hypothetical protein
MPSSAVCHHLPPAFALPGAISPTNSWIVGYPEVIHFDGLSLNRPCDLEVSDDEPYARVGIRQSARAATPAAITKPLATRQDLFPRPRFSGGRLALPSGWPTNQRVYNFRVVDNPTGTNSRRVHT